MSDKIYCGKGKERHFENGGSLIGVMLDVDTLAANFKEHGFTTNGENPRRKIKVNVYQNRDGADQYGNTHYVTIDTWKPDTGRPDYPTPDGNASNTKVVTKSPSEGLAAKVFDGDIPF